jgi:parallel beta-helix repeat protein
MARYFVSKSGSDSYNGLSDTGSWLTIQKAASTVSPGDLVRVRSGLYDERISITTRTGTLQNPIIYVADPGTIARGFQLNPGHNSKIINFEITQTGTATNWEGIYLIGSRNCEIIDNYIHNTDQIGIRMSNGGTVNCIIRGNRVEYPRGVPGDSVGENAIAFGFGTGNLVEYNSVKRVGDYTNIGGVQNIVRNNYFGECSDSDFTEHVGSGVLGHHTDGVQVAIATNNVVCNKILIDSNFMDRNVLDNGHFVLMRNTSDLRQFCHTIVTRYNVIANIGSADGYEGVSGVKLYNNTYCNNNVANLPKRGAVSFENSNNHTVLNNIFFDVSTPGYPPYSNTLAGSIPSCTGLSGNYNLSYLGGDLTGIYEITGIDPQFILQTGGRYQLKGGSIAINSGGPLTYASANGTNTNILNVYDSTFFFDGYGITSGDKIIVGSSNYTVITGINYLENQLLINSNITYSAGDSVRTTRNRDIGAYPYIANSGYDIQANLVQNGENSYVINTNYKDIINFVIFYEDGIPRRQLYDLPFTYQSSGGYVTAKAYHLYASATPVVEIDRAWPNFAAIF